MAKFDQLFRVERLKGGNFLSAQIKSKKRVVDFGEVYTNEREINAMLDLVIEETNRIESRFLEPACGNGNFCAAVLKRKLDVVKNKYKKNQTEYEKYAFVAVSSIYGIDILKDNVQECQDRLLGVFVNEYVSLYRKKINGDVLDAIRFVLSKNILYGDALTMKHTDQSSLVVAEWSMMSRGMVKRRDYIYEELMQNPKTCKPIAEEEMSLFDIGKEIPNLPKSAFIPKPIKEYPLKHYKKLNESEGGNES